MDTRQSWHPPDFSNTDSGTLSEIKTLFSDIYEQDTYGDLAENISQYWISKLADVWDKKAEKIKEKDLLYNPTDPLSRIEQKTVLISYADSVQKQGEPTLQCLETFLNTNFPAIRGLHMLPACVISQERFNDGGFSQIKRDCIHAPYGSNEQFEKMMETFYSMADFVLNHVDIDNPEFQKYLDGDDQAGECFFVYSEKEYEERLKNGDFKQIFRPRPFPLFTIFRRKPEGSFVKETHENKISILNQRFENQQLTPLPDEFLNILYIFNKIKNDQMLLEEDYKYVTQFRDFLANSTSEDPENLFTLSETQETQTIPYIFIADIKTPEDLLTRILPAINIPVQKALSYAEIYIANEKELFGEQIRALTTFSHVQVDLNLSTYEGLKLLIDDFSWYLKMNLNMLRLDAANFAFKKWGTSCFGLPEGTKLLKILYLSMDAVSPRIVPNLEVNAPLSTVLQQMADKQAPPPMMYDFHLASMLPIVFNTSDASPLLEINRMINQYDIPHESIRFSLDESHDGKSVNGSGGSDPLLTYAQRNNLINVVKANKGHVKYKSSPKHQYPVLEFKKVCKEAGLDMDTSARALFQNYGDETNILFLKDAIRNPTDIADALGISPGRLEKESALLFFTTKILIGKEPYELCVSTRDALKKTDNASHIVERYLAFKTLSFGLMGRHVKSIYFNDLMGLENDHELVKNTGELRNIKRTKSDKSKLEHLINEPSAIESLIAKNMNNLIALVDCDPAFNPRGDATKLVVEPDRPAMVLIKNSYKDHTTLIVINISGEDIRLDIQLSDFGLNNSKELIDCLTGNTIPNHSKNDSITLGMSPFGKFWIKNKKVNIPDRLLVEAGFNSKRKVS